MKNMLLGKYIANSRNGSRFTDAELKILREGNIKELAETFLICDNKDCKKQLITVLESIDFYLKDNITFEKIDKLKKIDKMFVGGQFMTGDEEVFLGISGSEEALVEIASIFADEKFSEFGIDAYDALCEFINCTNGKMAQYLESQEINVTLKPPVFYNELSISSKDGVYLAQFDIGDNTFDIIMLISDNILLSDIA